MAKAVDEEGKREVLQRLWDWDGITEETARRMVAPVTLRADAPLPDWAEWLGQVLTTPVENESPAFFQADAPMAFQEILLPFLLVFERALQASVGWDRLSPKAQSQVTRNLLAMLSFCSIESLYLDFNSFRNRQPFGALAVVAVQKDKPPSTTLYQKFVAQMRAGGSCAWLNKYAVLARLLATLTLLRVRSSRSFWPNSTPMWTRWRAFSIMAKRWDKSSRSRSACRTRIAAVTASLPSDLNPVCSSSTNPKTLPPKSPTTIC